MKWKHLRQVLYTPHPAPCTLHPAPPDKTTSLNKITKDTF